MKFKKNAEGKLVRVDEEEVKSITLKNLSDTLKSNFKNVTVISNNDVINIVWNYKNQKNNVSTGSIKIYDKFDKSNNQNLFLDGYYLYSNPDGYVISSDLKIRKKYNLVDDGTSTARITKGTEKSIVKFMKSII